jgi:hypothetical protein
VGTADVKGHLLGHRYGVTQFERSNQVEVFLHGGQ